MKEFVLQNIDKFKRYPITFVALLFIYLYFNELSANKEACETCQSDLKQKDIQLAASAERERRMNDLLLEFAFQIRMLKQSSDSTIRKETEQNVNKILKR